MGLTPTVLWLGLGVISRSTPRRAGPYLYHASRTVWSMTAGRLTHPASSHRVNC